MILLCGQSLAQQNSGPFRKLDIGLSIQYNSNRNYFHDYWDTSPGMLIDLETPFYFGNINISNRYNQYDNRLQGLPDIHEYQISVGWVKRFTLAPRFELGAGTGFLVSIFSFRNAGVEEMLRAANRFGSTSPESEIGLRLKGDITYWLSNRWGVRLQWNRSVVHTHTKLKMNYLGVGVVWSVGLPDWMKEALK